MSVITSTLKKFKERNKNITDEYLKGKRDSELSKQYKISKSRVHQIVFVFVRDHIMCIGIRNLDKKKVYEFIYQQRAALRGPRSKGD